MLRGIAGVLTSCKCRGGSYARCISCKVRSRAKVVTHCSEILFCVCEPNAESQVLKFCQALCRAETCSLPGCIAYRGHDKNDIRLTSFPCGAGWARRSCIERTFRGHRGRLKVESLLETILMAIRVQALARGWSCRCRDWLATFKVEKQMRDLEKQLFGTVSQKQKGVGSLEPVSVRAQLKDLHHEVKETLGLVPKYAPPPEEQEEFAWLARQIMRVLETNNRWDPHNRRYGSLSAHNIAAKFFEKTGMLVYAMRRSSKPESNHCFMVVAVIIINHDEEAEALYSGKNHATSTPYQVFHYCSFSRCTTSATPSPPLTRKVFLPLQDVPKVSYHGHKVCRLWNVGLCPLVRDENNPTKGICHCNSAAPGGVEDMVHVCAACGNPDHRLPDCPVAHIRPAAETLSDKLRREAHRATCMRCEAKHATLLCTNCGEVHCAECSAHIHSAENVFARLVRPHHQLVRITANENDFCFCWECNELRNELLIYGASALGTHDELRRAAAVRGQRLEAGRDLLPSCTALNWRCRIFMKPSQKAQKSQPTRKTWLMNLKA